MSRTLSALTRLRLRLSSPNVTFKHGSLGRPSESLASENPVSLRLHTSALPVLAQPESALWDPPEMPEEREKHRSGERESGNPGDDHDWEVTIRKKMIWI